MDKVRDLVPDATALLDKLDARSQQVNQLGEDLTADIEALQERIGLARGEANRVGRKFILTHICLLLNRSKADERVSLAYFAKPECTHFQSGSEDRCV